MLSHRDTHALYYITQVDVSSAACLFAPARKATVRRLYSAPPHSARAATSQYPPSRTSTSKQATSTGKRIKGVQFLSFVILITVENLLDADTQFGTKVNSGSRSNWCKRGVDKNVQNCCGVEKDFPFVSTEENWCCTHFHKCTERSFSSLTYCVVVGGKVKIPQNGGILCWTTDPPHPPELKLRI